ncbi:MAG: SAP domain-containing protein [Candidatus Omnitrophota bacterium]
MKLKELKEKAGKLGIKPKPGTKKKILIHSIQVAEGNFPCFGTANDYCDQLECCWRNNCLPK